MDEILNKLKQIECLLVTPQEPNSTNERSNSDTGELQATRRKISMISVFILQNSDYPQQK